MDKVPSVTLKDLKSDFTRECIQRIMQKIQTSTKLHNIPKKSKVHGKWLSLWLESIALILGWLFTNCESFLMAKF